MTTTAAAIHTLKLRDRILGGPLRASQDTQRINTSAAIFGNGSQMTHPKRTSPSQGAGGRNSQHLGIDFQTRAQIQKNNQPPQRRASENRDLNYDRQSSKKPARKFSVGVPLPVQQQSMQSVASKLNETDGDKSHMSLVNSNDRNTNSGLIVTAEGLRPNTNAQKGQLRGNNLIVQINKKQQNNISESIRAQLQPFRNAKLGFQGRNGPSSFRKTHESRSPNRSEFSYQQAITLSPRLRYQIGANSKVSKQQQKLNQHQRNQNIINPYKTITDKSLKWNPGYQTLDQFKVNWVEIPAGSIKLNAQCKPEGRQRSGSQVSSGNSKEDSIERTSQTFPRPPKTAGANNRKSVFKNTPYHFAGPPPRTAGDSFLASTFKTNNEVQGELQSTHRILSQAYARIEPNKVMDSFKNSVATSTAEQSQLESTQHKSSAPLLTKWRYMNKDIATTRGTRLRFTQNLLVKNQNINRNKKVLFNTIATQPNVLPSKGSRLLNKCLEVEQCMHKMAFASLKSPVRMEESYNNYPKVDSDHSFYQGVQQEMIDFERIKPTTIPQQNPQQKRNYEAVVLSNGNFI